MTGIGTGAPSGMSYRRLGRTNLHVSVVGFGTSQLRLVPRRQAIGLIADDTEQFAQHVLRFWADRALCRTLGEAARETIRAEHSTAHTAAALSSVLERRSSRKQTPRTR